MSMFSNNIVSEITGYYDHGFVDLVMNEINDRLDLRYNNIEGMLDFMTLINRELQKNPRLSTIILTVEQLETLQEDASLPVGAPVLTFYGYTIETRPQD